MLLKDLVARTGTLLAAPSGQAPGQPADAPHLTAQVLAGHVLGLGRAGLITHAATPVAPQDAAHVRELARRRRQGEPLAYLVGCKEFFSRSFAVSRATLIPRPETEEMCEAVLAALPPAPLRFADIGTGTGCIGLTLLAERPRWRGLLADIDAAALAVARENALNLSIAANLLAADMCALPLAAGSLDLVVSNPPYVSPGAYATLAVEVRGFEPPHALVPQRGRGLPRLPDPQGLGLVATLAGEAARVLRPGGYIYVEHGAEQGAAVRGIFATSGLWRDVGTGVDLAGHERWCHAQRR